MLRDPPMLFGFIGIWDTLALYLDICSVNVEASGALVETNGGLFAGFKGKCIVHEPSEDGAFPHAVLPTQNDLVVWRTRRHC